MPCRVKVDIEVSMLPPTQVELARSYRFFSESTLTLPCLNSVRSIERCLLGRRANLSLPRNDATCCSTCPDSPLATELAPTRGCVAIRNLQHTTLALWPCVWMPVVITLCHPYVMPSVMSMSCHQLCLCHAISYVYAMPSAMPMSCHQLCLCRAISYAYAMPSVMSMPCHQVVNSLQSHQLN